ncbi:hypothetical protein IP90_00344 [Luteimonas cucumeris]|uniref:Uncharacterized protein n=1 Tax=Luteimonas cucumeris TaxID=985012 RepID=A0A562LEN9_9GAMM|nr:hypothetical protein [Luteimonas cucumeris]TWI06081.1 hypothetical protein IP90_00344 [Luteimonas cucumeris]
MARHYDGFYVDKDELIKKLKSDLWMTRYALLNRAPSAFYQMLSSYLDCGSKEETYPWLDNVAEEVVKHADLLPGSIDQWSGARAMCPLCGEGANSYYEQGFAYPEGLRRHLVGYGNTHQCVFTDTAMMLARESWTERFAEEEKTRRQENHRQQEARRKVEALYRIEPFEPPRLLDEDLWYGATTRKAQQMREAFDRLSEMGLKHIIDGAVEAWIDEKDEFVVYADPRQFGRIEFTVWKKPLPKRTPSHAYKYRIGSFHILDTWKNDLKKKYEARLPARDM